MLPLALFWIRWSAEDARSAAAAILDRTLGILSPGFIRHY